MKVTDYTICTGMAKSKLANKAEHLVAKGSLWMRGKDII